MLVNKYKSRAVLLAVIAVISICSGCAGSGSSLADAGTASGSVSEFGTVSESRTVSESGTVSESKPVSESGLEAELQADPDIVTSRADLPFQTGTETAVPGFTGNAYLGQMISDEEVYNFPQTNHIIFEPGARSSWHTHEGGQILIATDGIGYHQIEGQPVEVLYPGDVAFCPPGVKHWHGGSADTSFAHIAVNTNPERPGVEWFDILSDKEYAQLPQKNNDQ